MKRGTSFIFIFVTAFLLLVPAYAQEGSSVRGKDRDGYSRIIFDLQNQDSFETDQSQSGKISLKFKTSSDVTVDIETNTLKNILGYEVLSKAPLSISFDIPNSSKARAFASGARVFLDVYNPQNPEDRVVVEKKPDVKKTDVAQIPQQTEADKKPTEEKKKPEEEEIKSVETKAKAVPPAIVLIPEDLERMIKEKEAEKLAQLAKKEAEDKKEKHNQFLEEAIDQNQHVISVSSTSAVNMAMFENYETLWFVMDDDSFHTAPSLNSPAAYLFGDFKKIEISKGALYTVSKPKGFKAKGNGGELLWRLILSDDIKEEVGVEPIRIGASSGGGARKGHVLWPLENIIDVIKLRDSATGKDLHIVLVSDSSSFFGEERSFVDFDVLKSYAGLAIRSKVDDLIVEQVEEGIKIYREGGLSIMPDSLLSLAIGKGEKDALVDLNQNPQEEYKEESPSIFKFSLWQKSSLEELNQNKNSILAAMGGKKKFEQVEDLMILGKMHLAYGRGAEALGFLEYARQIFPEIVRTPEFLALRGVARAFMWKSVIALQDLSHPALNEYQEIKYWKAFVLAELGDWKQAADILPPNYNVLHDYPVSITSRLGLSLAEINLRAGEVNKAEEILAMIGEHDLSAPMEAAVTYLKGEAFRQRGNVDETISLWTSLEKNPDDLYRTKARLALAILLSNEGKANTKEVIDRLEPLRYEWRGDQLEAQILYWMGQYYFKDKNFVKGLNIMRDASSLAVNTALGERIASSMTEEFAHLFLDDAELKEMSALDAIALYDKFSELTPPGDDGSQVVQKLAEKMVKADLLDRASDLLKHQVDFRLSGENRVKAAMRLAAIELLAKRPDHAMQSLTKAERGIQDTKQMKDKERKLKEIALMKARAYSQDRQGDLALALLENLDPDPDVSRLIAEIAWQQGYWDDAAYAFNEVIIEENISLADPLSKRHAEMIMNRSIALNLASDKVALANMRKKYYSAMLETEFKNQFDLVTRPGRKSTLADRETLMSIVSEVNLFEDFLTKFKNGDEVGG
ncbi:MAG: hypothetical protein OEY94_02765 [Alphaproteobacteria bacterium]|nr:hypothetical protein [Alphaproteobacteria bacterium]